MQTFPTDDEKQIGKNNNRQHSLYVLHKQTGRSAFSFPMHRSHETMELVPYPQYYYCCVLPPRTTEHDDRHIEQTVFPGTQMGAERQSSTTHIPRVPQWGLPVIDLFATTQTANAEAFARE